MVIWSRFGFLVLVIGFGVLLLTQLVVDSATGVEGYYTNHAWPKIVAGIVAAVPIWFLGTYLNTQTVERTVTDDETGEQMAVTSGGGHTFFFIPMQYWAPILIVLSFVIAFT